MQNFLAIIKGWGQGDTVQAMAALIMSGIAHLCDKDTLGVIAGILAVVFISMQIRGKYIDNCTATFRRERERRRLERECGE